LQATGQVTNLSLIFLTLVGGSVISFGGRLVVEHRMARIGAIILNDLRVRMFKHLQQLSQGFYQRTPIGTILARFSRDLVDIEKAAGRRMRDLIFHSLEIVYNFPFLFYLNWQLATLSLILLGGMAWMFGRMIPSTSAAGYRLKSSEARLVGKIQENVLAQGLIRAFGFESQMLDRFESQIADLTEDGAIANYYQARISLAAKAWMMGSRLIIIGAGVFMVTGDYMTLGSLIAFLNLFELVNASADDLIRSDLPDFVGTISGIQRVEELLNERPDIQDSADAVTVPPLRQAIEIKDVSFSYTGEEANLEAIDMVIPAGASVAFVGASGSGKSTLLDLLMRNHDATTGAIYLDGVDLRQVRRSSIQEQIGVVFQESYLFDTTIRENIRMAKPDAGDAEVEQAAQLAEIHDYVMSLPQQYDTPVGEAGSFLSGGQRQRIAIARAIIRNPAILILDEATSALDPATEAAINATLRRLARNRTVITVTHRLSSVVDADCIYVLQDGRLAEFGTHTALQEQNGVYARLWQKQTGFEVSADGRTGVVHAAYLRHLEIFSSLDFETLTTLANRFTPEYIGEGQLVFKEGEMGDRLYLIARGQVEVLMNSQAQGDLYLATLHDGDHFGEMALLSDEARNASVRTLTDSLFLTLPKSEFLTLLDTLPAVHAAVTTAAAQRAMLSSVAEMMWTSSWAPEATFEAQPQASLAPVASWTVIQ
ncbi:MAG: ATP-binding cassette domain-containing protein, partial [Anaerolineae bacterium]|nr:ATP-binding cassette domain-containing protein [Anaerolineae bacterium]